MLIHVSAMDLQRNVDRQLAIGDMEEAHFDAFAPGWRRAIDVHCSRQELRSRVLAYWSTLIEGLGMKPFSDSRLIKGGSGQRLYWLMLAARSPLAQKLWTAIGRADLQGEFGLKAAGISS